MRTDEQACRYRDDTGLDECRPAVEESELLRLVTAVLWPRPLMADNVLATYRDYLMTLP